MASAIHGVWAIDIGTNALKALQMQQADGVLEVTDFAYMEHSKNLLSGNLSPVEKEQIISETLQRFLEEKDLSRSEVAISIAGQNSFARFISLPPVESKKIPEVVQFEAVQQIPFDLNITGDIIQTSGAHITQTAAQSFYTGEPAGVLCPDRSDGTV